MDGLAFALANVMVLVGAIIATRILAPRGSVPTLLSVLTCFTAQVVLTVIVVGGFLQDLTPLALLLASALVSAAILALYLRLRRRGGLQSATDTRFRMRRVAGELLRSPWALALVVLATVVAVWAGIANYLYPIHDWDGMVYHMVAVAAWTQAHKIYVTPYNLQSNTFPENTEALFTWLAVFPRGDVFVRLAQLVFVTAGALAVTGLARVVGLRRTTAIACGCLFVLTPVVVAQLTTTYVDVAFACWLLVFLYFLDCTKNHFTWGSVVLTGLAAGLTIGTKSTGLADVPICLAVVGSIAVFERRASFEPLATAARTKLERAKARGSRLAPYLLTLVPARDTVGQASKPSNPVRPRPSQDWQQLRQLAVRSIQVGLVIAVPTVALGAYWYLRTWVAFGNPLYPFALNIPGFAFPSVGTVETLAVIPVTPQDLVGKPGWMQLVLSWLMDPGMQIGVANSQGFIYQYSQRPGGLGPQWTLLFAPAMVGFAIYSLWKRRDIFVLLVLPFALILLAQPSVWWSRFTISLVALGVIAFGFLLEFLLDALRGRWRAVGYGLQVVALALVLYSLTLSELAVTFPPSYLADLAQTSQEGHTYGAYWDPSFHWVDQVKPGSHIAETSTTLLDSWIVYPLFGAHYQNQICPVEAPNGEGLLQSLRSCKAEYLMMSTRPHDQPYAAWALADSAHYHLLYQTSYYLAFAVSLDSKANKG